MTAWTVELDVSFLVLCNQWPKEQRLELLALIKVLTNSGPEGLGFLKSEWETPDWDDLSSPVSLPLPVRLSMGWKTLALDILPGRKMVIVSLA